MKHSWKYGVGDKYELYVTETRIMYLVFEHLVRGSVFRPAGTAVDTPYHAAMVYRGRVTESESTFENPEDGKYWVERMIEKKVEIILTPVTWETPSDGQIDSQTEDGGWKSSSRIG